MVKHFECSQNPKFPLYNITGTIVPGAVTEAEYDAYFERASYLEALQGAYSMKSEHKLHSF